MWTSSGYKHIRIRFLAVQLQSHCKVQLQINEMLETAHLLNGKATNGSLLPVFRLMDHTTSFSIRIKTDSRVTWANEQIHVTDIMLHINPGTAKVTSLT